MLRFYSQAAGKTQHFLVRICNLFDSVPLPFVHCGLCLRRTRTYSAKTTKYIICLFIEQLPTYVRSNVSYRFFSSFLQLAKFSLNTVIYIYQKKAVLK